MQYLDDTQLVTPFQPHEESANSSEGLYIPQVKKELIPKLKQRFGNLEEVLNFYNSYAREAGFCVRINSSKTGKSGETNRKEYVCNEEGQRKNSKPTTRHGGLTREGCRAKLAVVKNRSGEGFVVFQFVEGHNHPLTMPRKVHLLKSDCQVSDAQKLVATSMPTCQQMGKRDKRKLFEGHDTNMLCKHFEVEQQKNPDFVFSMERDDEGRMTHCFWADATCRKSYQYFGDVVVFDTAYNTNRYSFIFAPILGVNHHGQPTLFGCAFLSDETTDSFEWLFKEWLKAMSVGPPKMIITDHDLAMTKAIACALPNTFHRYCIWHIVDKFAKCMTYEHYDEFEKCIWNSESPEEFEARWVDVVGKFKLSNNEWLQAMYKIRDRWVPAYTKHIFSAQMTTSQRAEISHSFFKRYVSKKNSLVDFVTQFNRALSHIRQDELDLDYKDVNEKPVLRTADFMEERMSELYTRYAFYKSQEEIFQMGAYVVKKKHEDEHQCVWDAQWVKLSKALTACSRRSCDVLVDKLLDHVSCSCKMFEFDGIPCRHMLTYLSRKQMEVELPTQYILQRWTNAAKAGRGLNELGSCANEIRDPSVVARRHGIFPLACNVVDDAILDEEGTEILREALQLAQKKIALMRSSHKERSMSGIQLPVSIGSQHSFEEPCQVSGIQVPISLGSQHSFKEPRQVRAKGGGKRLKVGQEKAVKKSRKCNGCGLTGQLHDKRNCPKLQNMYSQDVRLDDDDNNVQNF